MTTGDGGVAIMPIGLFVVHNVLSGSVWTVDGFRFQSIARSPTAPIITKFITPRVVTVSEYWECTGGVLGEQAQVGGLPSHRFSRIVNFAADAERVCTTNGHQGHE